MKNLVFLCLLLASSGCSVNKDLELVRDLSSVEDKDTVKINTVNLEIVRIDDQEISGRAFILDPGNHSFTVRVSGGNINPIKGEVMSISSEGTQDVIIETKPGCRYSIQASLEQEDKTWSTKTYAYYNTERGIGIPLFTSKEERKKIRAERAELAKKYENSCSLEEQG